MLSHQNSCHGGKIDLKEEHCELDEREQKFLMTRIIIKKSVAFIILQRETAGRYLKQRRKKSNLKSISNYPDQFIPQYT